MIIQGNVIILISIECPQTAFAFRYTGSRCNRGEATSDITIPSLPRNLFEDEKTEAERTETRYQLFRNLRHGIKINQPTPRNYLPPVQHGELPASHSRRSASIPSETLFLIDCPNSMVQGPRSGTDSRSARNKIPSFDWAQKLVTVFTNTWYWIR
jgi:hypothetical protein